MEKNGSKFLVLLEGILCILGICVFALLIQRDSFIQYFAYAGLLLAAFSISRSTRTLSSLLVVFGLQHFSIRVIYYTMAGLVFGFLLAILNNLVSGDDILPGQLAGFAIIAPIIGITEELVFRGFVQSQMGKAGLLPGIVIPSSGHAFYKFLVIKTLPYDLDVNFASLVLLTFLAGIVFGILRHCSKSVIPPAAAHAIFDIVIYGGLISAPVWVWT
jgi:membrane protease YdiL (CAAX protease family)